MPGSSPTNKVSLVTQARKWGRIAHTIENRTDENSGEICLLLKVQVVRDLWGIGIIGPGFVIRVRHDSDADEGERLWRGPDRKWGEGVSWWSEDVRVRQDWSFKAQRKSIEP